MLKDGVVSIATCYDRRKNCVQMDTIDWDSFAYCCADEGKIQSSNVHKKQNPGRLCIYLRFFFFPCKLGAVLGFYPFFNSVKGTFERSFLNEAS